jgi:X-X-X-Leu-X-X-Gly heptad repeats
MKLKNVKKSGYKLLKRSFVIMLSVIVTFSFHTSVKADDQNKDKEEVVYGILNTDGSVNGIYVVNIFDYKGNISDYGNYSSVRNMTTEDNIAMSDNKISVTNTANKLSYEGTLKKQELPWNISVKYYLDGKAYSSDEIAGKSGALSIKMKITQNEKCDETFYKNYALQANVTLDTNKCSNVIADNATVANVGSDKQLAYTILPGKGADITITADVKDFEMKAVTINGIRLNLDIQVDDSKLKEKVRDLTDGVDKLDNGAIDLHDGVVDLRDGTDDLRSGVKKLKDGSSDLDVGAKSLKDGISKIQEALNELNSKSDTLTTGSAQVKAALIEIQTSLTKVSVSADKIGELVNASSQIKTAINQIYTGLDTLKSNVGYAQYKAAMKNGGLDIDQLQAGNKAAIASLKAQIASLTDSYNKIKDVPGYATQASQLKTQIDQFSNLVTLLNGDIAAIGGTETYLNSLSTAISGLYDGAAELNKQYETFDAAIVELSQSLSGILVDMSKLSSGINTLVDKYTILDKGINDYTSGVAQIVAGYSGIVNGVDKLSAGSEKLSSGNQTLYSNTRDLTTGVSKLYDGTTDLTEGTGEFKDKTSNMESEVNEQIDNALSEIEGDGSKVVSFVSEKNTNIKAVQFVIKTQAIEKKEVVTTTEKPKEKLNIWEKILHLFGLD